MNNKKDKNAMSFLDHLGELRWHLVRSSIAIIIFAVVAFLAKSVIFDQIIFGPKQPNFPTYTFFCWLSDFVGGEVFCFKEMPFELLNMRMSGQFQMHLWVSLVAGLSSPSLMSFGRFGDSSNQDCTSLNAKALEE